MPEDRTNAFQAQQMIDSYDVTYVHGIGGAKGLLEPDYTELEHQAQPNKGLTSYQQH